MTVVGQRHRHDRREARHARLHRSTPARRSRRRRSATTPTRSSPAPASSTTWSAASPGPGVWALGTIEHPRQRHYLNLYKLGEGPLYCFYTPYHLCHFEVPMTDRPRRPAAATPRSRPIGAPCVEVLTMAKRDLKAGEEIDALGGYTVYGEAETAAITARDGLLPIGVAVGCKLRRDIPKDAALTYADVELPAGRLVDKLRAEQDALFGLKRRAA